MVVNAIVLIKVERGKVNDVAQHIVNLDGVSEVFSVAGRYDLVAVLRAHSNEHVADIVTKAVQGQSGIQDTETLLAFKAYAKEDLEAAFSIGNEERA
jgi:DNA-binding Lrp family transcriptional regulator